MLKIKYVRGYFFCLFALIVYGCAGTETIMEPLVLKNDELPVQCGLAAVENGLPFDVDRNPMISTEKSFISTFVGAVFDNRIDPTKVREVLYSVYDQREELYVFGFEFISDHAAGEAEETIFYSFPDLLTLRKNHVIVVMWHDGAEHPCFEKVYNSVKQRLDDMPQKDE